MSLDVSDFLRASAGRWFSQRNSHYLAMRRSEAGRSDLEITYLEPTEARVIELCHLHQFDPSRAIGGLAIEWQGTVGLADDPHGGHALLVAVPDEPGATEGSMLRNGDETVAGAVVARYRLADDALTLTTLYDETELEERLWFASPNLRLRATLIKRWGKFSTTTFCSEVRKGDTAPKVEAKTKARVWPSQQNALPDWIKEELESKGLEMPTEPA